MIDVQYYEWLSLFFRWFHVIAAIAWIGASFYFVWLDNSLQSPSMWKQDRGVSGDLWAFHGGGIYEVSKYRLAPKEMPTTLHWFKWEAYVTWITGSVLLCIIYYFNADLYLVSDHKWIRSPSLGILASLLFLFTGVMVYEILFKLLYGRKNQVFALTISLYIAVACFISVNLFNDRAAFLHVGAMIASIMAANVFLGIIPAQKGFIYDLDQNRTPAQPPMLKAKLRSIHNNYFTLPVIFCMISNHYSFLYGHTFNWLILVFIIGLTAYVRHYFNLKHRGKHKPIILLISGILLVVLALIVSMDIAPQRKPQPNYTDATSENTAKELARITAEHCQVCHSRTPSQPGFSTAPAGIHFDTLEDVKKSKLIVLNAVKTQYMPLANITKMSDQERSDFISLLERIK